MVGGGKTPDTAHAGTPNNLAGTDGAVVGGIVFKITFSIQFGTSMTQHCKTNNFPMLMRWYSTPQD